MIGTKFMSAVPAFGGLRVFKVWQFLFSWTACWAQRCFVCTVHVQDVHSGIFCRLRKIHSRVLFKIGALDVPRGSSGLGSSFHSLLVPFLEGQLRSLKLRRPKKKKNCCLPVGFRFPASSPDATCGDEILFQCQTSSLILFRKQTNQPMSCTPLQCSGTGSDSLQRLLNDCGNWKSWERKLQFFFDSSGGRVNIPFPNFDTSELSCLVC